MKILLLILAAIGLAIPAALFACVLVAADALRWFGEKVRTWRVPEKIEPQHMADVTDFAERARVVRERIRRRHSLEVG